MCEFQHILRSLQILVSIELITPPAAPRSWFNGGHKDSVCIETHCSDNATRDLFLARLLQCFGGFVSFWVLCLKCVAKRAENQAEPAYWLGCNISIVLIIINISTSSPYHHNYREDTANICSIVGATCQQTHRRRRPK